jgi:hypothetical protein
MNDSGQLYFFNRSSQNHMHTHPLMLHRSKPGDRLI